MTREYSRQAHCFPDNKYVCEVYGNYLKRKLSACSTRTTFLPLQDWCQKSEKYLWCASTIVLCNFVTPKLSQVCLLSHLASFVIHSPHIQNTFQFRFQVCIWFQSLTLDHTKNQSWKSAYVLPWVIISKWCSTCFLVYIVFPLRGKWYGESRKCRQAPSRKQTCCFVT